MRDESCLSKEVLLLFPDAALLPCIAVHSLDRLSVTWGEGGWGGCLKNLKGGERSSQYV